MKLLLLIFMLSVQTFCYSQTKQETIDWIMAKCNQGHLDYSEHFGYYRIDIEININGRFKIYQTCYKDLLKVANDIPSSKFLNEGDIKDLNPTSVATFVKNGTIRINAGCTDSKNCITIKEFKHGAFVYAFDYNSVNWGYISDSEPNIEERLKKALIHLIKLYGGKVETF